MAIVWGSVGLILIILAIVLGRHFYRQSQKKFHRTDMAAPDTSKPQNNGLQVVQNEDGSDDSSSDESSSSSESDSDSDGSDDSSEEESDDDDDSDEEEAKSASEYSELDDSNLVQDE